MKVSSMLAAAAAVFASVVAPSASAEAVSQLDDIHYWVGEGTNRCAVVINWSYYETAKAWGFRWNGESPNVAEIVARIAREDPRLQVGIQGMTSSFVDLYFFGYDVNDRHPVWDMESEFGAASDPDALVLREDTAYFSAWWVFYGPMNGTYFPSEPQTSSWTAANQTHARNNDWFVFSYGCPDYDPDWNEAPAELPQPEAAESPYGYSVVDYFTEERNAYYNDPWNVLGHPSACMDDPSVYWGGQNFGGVINPVNPAWGEGRLFTLSSWGDEELDPGEENGPGYVTIAFDHDVVDDPANPFGLDFIVFGNALVNGDGSYYNPGTDPASFRLLGTGVAEQAKVEVSQDGENWFSDPAWRYADDFAPTLGHLYEPGAADTALFAGNRYWGRATLATKPVDPRVGFSNCAGKTLAEICNYYNGSAGGTGYDISNLNLEPDAQGRKWFRYVRISGVYSDVPNEDGDFGYTEPEVDAVADVAPVSGYDKWVERNYTDWTTVWQQAVSGPEALAANGRPNAVNYLLGLDANDTSADLDFRIASFVPASGEFGSPHTLTVVSRMPITEDCGLVVKHAEKPNDKVWTPELPWVEDAEERDGLWTTTLSVSTYGGPFLKLGLDLK